MDSGATRSIVSTDLLAQIPNKTNLTRTIGVRVANSMRDIITEETTFEVEIGQIRRKYTFLVYDKLPYPVFLGLDFLRAFRLSIIGTDDPIKVETADHFVLSTIIEEEDEDEWDPEQKASAVEMAETITLEPCSVGICAIRVKTVKEGLALIEPIGHTEDVTSKPGMVMVEGNVALYAFWNTSLCPVIMPKGKIVGFSNQPGCIEKETSVYAISPVSTMDFNIADHFDSAHTRQILQNNQDLFATDLSELTQTDVCEHKIELLEGAEPVVSRPYRTSRKEDEYMEKQIKEYLKYGIIEESSSAFASPYLLVPKKNGSLRFVTNFIRLNKISKGDAYPLPRIQDLVDSMGGKIVWSVMDLFSGYWQIKVAEESRDKTAFITIVWALPI